MIRQDQVGQRAGVVEKAGEAADEAHLLQLLAHAPGLRRGKDRIGAVEKQDLRLGKRVETLAAGNRPRAGRAAGLRHEIQAAFDAGAAGERVQRVDRQRGEQTIGVCERHPAGHSHGGTQIGKGARDPIEAAGRHAGDLLDSIRRELSQSTGPPLDRLARPAAGIGRPQLVLDDDAGEAERQNTFRAGRHRNPFVGAGPGLRHSLFDLDERAADLRMPLPHLTVSEVLRDR